MDVGRVGACRRGPRSTPPARIRPQEDLPALGDALDALAASDPRLADLKFFCGFSLREIAGMRGVSERTVQRDWTKARLHLHRSLSR